MKLRTHTELTSELAERWGQLENELEGATPFQSSRWLRAYWASFQPEGIRILEFLDSDQTVGIVSVLPFRARRYFRRLQWIEFGGSRYADYSTALVHPNYEAEVAQALITALGESSWDALYFGNFRADQGFLKWLAMGSRLSRLHVRARDCSPVRSLPYETYKSYSESGTRWSSDKLLKKLEKRGKLDFEIHKDYSAIASLLPEFFQMHRVRFQSRGLESMFGDPHQEQFFIELARNFSIAGDLWLSVLRCDGQPIAMRYSLKGGNRLHLYSTCFNSEFAAFSPSSHQLRFLLETAFRSAVKIVDLGIGTSPHKELPGTQISQELVCLEIYRGRVGVFETVAFDRVQALRRRFGLVERLGKGLRKFLPNTT